MNHGSGLAAVHLAAAGNTTALQPPPQPPRADVTTSTAEAPSAAQPTTIAELTAAFPELCAQLRADGASAERNRIFGIEAHLLAGHEKLIAEMKADPSVTPDMAAGRVLAAEKALRAGKLQAVQDVEKVTGAVASAPAAVTRPGDAPKEPEKAETPEAWTDEWKASAKLQAEFPQVEHYVAFKKADTAGRIRVLTKKSA